MDDTNAANRKFQKEIKAGTVALVLLGVLDQAEEPQYGYLIAKRLETGGPEAEHLKQGALYPVLRSLEKSGLLASEVQASVTGPPRRYYRITETGRNTLREWVRIWSHHRDFVDAVLGGSYHV